MKLNHEESSQIERQLPDLSVSSPGSKPDFMQTALVLQVLSDDDTAVLGRVIY